MFTLKLHIDKWLYDADRFGNDVEYEVANPDMPLIELLDEIRKKFEIKDYDISSNLPIKTLYDFYISIALPQGDGGIFFCDIYDENGREATLSSYNIRSGDSIFINGTAIAGGGVVDEFEVPNMLLRYYDALDAAMTLNGFTFIRYIRERRRWLRIYSHPYIGFPVIAWFKGSDVSVETDVLLKDVFPVPNGDPFQPLKLRLLASPSPFYGKKSSLCFRAISWLQAKLELLKKVTP